MHLIDQRLDLKRQIRNSTIVRFRVEDAQELKKTLPASPDDGVEQVDGKESREMGRNEKEVKREEKKAYKKKDWTRGNKLRVAKDKD